MKTSYRAFTPDFCRHMTKRAAWLPIDSALDWFQKDIGGIRRERYKQLKEGETFNEKYAESLVRRLLKSATSNPPTFCGRGFGEYLAAHGISTPSQAKFEEVMASVCGPRLEKPPVASGALDYLQQGVDAIKEIITARRLIDRFQQNCATDEDFHDAATWLFVSGGRLTSSANAELSPDNALIAAENYIKISRDEYAERLKAWHEFNPWTVVLARGTKRPNAFSVVLPLSNEGYDELLAGRRPTYDCRADLLQVPTRKLLIEVAAERPHDLGAENANATRGLYANLFAQISAFLRPLDPTQSETIHILSYGDMPLFIKRLKSAGFKPTGKKMQKTGLPFFEKTVNTKTAHGRDGVMVAFLRQLGGMLDSPPAD